MVTDRQKEVLEYIKRHIDKYGYSPTYEKIGASLFCHRVSAKKLVDKLEEAGEIEIIARIPRTIIKIKEK